MDVMLKNNSKTEMVSLFGRSIAPGKTFPVEKRLIGHVAVRRLLDSGVLVYPKADKPEIVKAPETPKVPETPKTPEVPAADQTPAPEAPVAEKAPEVPATETPAEEKAPVEEEKAPEAAPEGAKKPKKKK